MSDSAGSLIMSLLSYLNKHELLKFMSRAQGFLDYLPLRTNSLIFASSCSNIGLLMPIATVSCFAMKSSSAV